MKMRIAALCLLGTILSLEGPKAMPTEDVRRETDPPVLDTPVQHRTKGILDEERAAYDHLLNHARETDEAEQQAAARRNLEKRRAEVAAASDTAEHEFSLFFDLLRFPEQYEGRPVTFEGRIRRLISRTAEDNEHGLETLYEAWLYPVDSPANPVLVVCTSIPEGMPEGETLVEQATVTGYFFKLSEYREGDETRVAPLVLAGGMEWHPQTASTAAEIDSALLTGVRDRTRGVSEAERDAYYHILRHATQVEEDEQRAAAQELISRRSREFAADLQNRREYSTFVDIFLNPEEFRGKAVTLRGHLRRLISYPAGENEYGLETLYEAWLYTAGSQSNPAVIICTSVPDDMPRPEGKDAVETVSVTGYFFKIYGYTAEDTARIAPMILANRLEWQPTVVPGPPEWLQTALYISIAVVFVALVWLLRRQSRKDREFRSRRLKELREPTDAEQIAPEP